jgi:hypothetical protein
MVLFVPTETIFPSTARRDGKQAYLSVHFLHTEKKLERVNLSFLSTTRPAILHCPTSHVRHSVLNACRRMSYTGLTRALVEQTKIRERG